MTRLADLVDLPHVRLGAVPTPVRRLELGHRAEVWVKDESAFGDGGWGGNKVRKLEWIIAEAHRRGSTTLLTVGGIGTHWGLACALYGREHGLRTVLGLVDQPLDDHVRDQLRRLEASGAVLHRYRSSNRLRLAAPYLMARYRPWYVPAGGSHPVGALAYVDVALEIADQVAAGALPEPATLVVPVGSGGTVAGLALGLRLAGLDRTRLLGVVVNDLLRLDRPSIARLAGRTGALLARAGLARVPTAVEADLPRDWLGEGYGVPTPAGSAEVARATEAGIPVEPVYTGKALAAVRELDARGELAGPVLWLATHGPR
ncbi:1-aminocyclopropane-1-carboxylate deaminase/D-cysteine desulfhydrase [Nocardioides sp.]|uniref:1-aminocyclopropane-1-carboxylate deaminase/D-cysteine desulfhydrase n=1 Tax=Nocardioides sp. TaxID=35761 RepID=UPI003783EC21